MIKADTGISGEIEFVEDGSKEVFFFMLLGDIPLQEIEGRIVFFLEGFFDQLVDLAGYLFFVGIDFFKEFFQAGVFRFRGGNRANMRHRARLAQIGKEALHMLHFFGRVRLEEFRCAGESFIVRPG